MSKAGGGRAVSALQRMVQRTPSGAKVKSTSAPSSCAKLRCSSLEPKPARAGGATGGPPCSAQDRIR